MIEIKVFKEIEPIIDYAKQNNCNNCIVYINPRQGAKSLKVDLEESLDSQLRDQMKLCLVIYSGVEYHDLANGDYDIKLHLEYFSHTYAESYADLVKEDITKTVKYYEESKRLPPRNQGQYFA